MNPKQENAPRGIWRLPWSLKLLYALGALFTVDMLVCLVHAKSLAGAVWYGGMTLIGASVTLNSPLTLGLNKTMPQVYRTARGGQLQTKAAQLLSIVGSGVLLLSVFFWLSSR